MFLDGEQSVMLLLEADGCQVFLEAIDIGCFVCRLIFSVMFHLLTAFSELGSRSDVGVQGIKIFLLEAA